MTADQDWIAGITFEQLGDDPYPIYERLRRTAPVVWAPALEMWMITRYAECRQILLDSARFVTGTPQSPIYDTFGEQMLTVEGDLHRSYRDTQLQLSFMPKAIGAALAPKIAQRVAQLVDGIAADGTAEIRSTIASRLPILVMFDLFGLPESDEALFRSWYDAFEAALANHGFDEAPRVAAAISTAAFHDYFQQHIDRTRRNPAGSLLDVMLARPADLQLDDASVRRNALIIFFGGISTVEALTLNALWALLTHPEALTATRVDRSLIGPALVETMRWLAPVQTAMRHAVCDVTVGRVLIPAGATVNCVLGAANRDPAMFNHPDEFKLGRANVARHLGFATGPHHCLGQHLAKAEATAAIAAMLERLPDFRLAEPTKPQGHEFRQPKFLKLVWSPNLR